MAQYLNMNLKMPWLSLIITLLSLALLVNSEPTSMPDTINGPVISKNMIPLDTTTSQKHKMTSLGFPDINFQISGAFYTHSGKIDESSMYKKQAYSSSVSQYCSLYKTTILTETKFRLKHKEDVEPLKYALFNSGEEDGNKFYMIGSDSMLHVYSFAKEIIRKDAEYAMDYRVGRVRDGAMKENAEMLVLGGRVFIANNESLWVFDPNNKENNFKLVKGFDFVGSLVDMGLVSEGSTGLHGIKFWVCSNTQITIYQINVDGEQISVMKSQQVIPTYQSIFAIDYSPESQYFHFVASRSLYSYKLGSEKPASEYVINGMCKHITRIKSTLFLGCEYDKINFVAEYRIEAEGKLVLNRYYDDAVVEGIRDVESLGYDKIALIGDQQAIIIGEAVNRNVLLDLAQSRTQQNFEYAYSFSLIDFYYLPQFSTPQHSSIFVVGQSSASIHVITYEPPQIECNFKDQTAQVVSVLAIFNTSHCPFAVDTEYNLGGTYTICSTYYPFRLELAKQEYEQKTAKFIFFIIMLLLVVLILVCAGFGVKIRNKANAVIQAMQAKLDRIHKEKQNSEMKKL